MDSAISIMVLAFSQHPITATYMHYRNYNTQTYIVCLYDPNLVSKREGWSIIKGHEAASFG